ncbi:MAG: NAD(P)-dependent oxidoreductase [Betaproteobacteria bacterium]|nr:NAD(P)-dependent oxidoreductase [Betaproteobacteria bacterium]
MKLGFLGLGIMGTPMTLRLLERGHSVTVWNRTPSKLAPALEQGARAAATPAEVATAADVVLMSLLDTRAVEEIVFGVNGIASARGEGKVLVDHASIRPDATREFAARLKRANGMEWIDAPVSGRVPGPQGGSLAIMAGGDPAAFEQVKPVLAAYGTNITRMGPIGAGQTTKLCNQIIVGTTIAIVAEAVRLAESAGVDASLLPAALAGGQADSRPLQTWAPRMVDGWTERLAAANLFVKDVGTALDVARETGAPLPVAEQVLALYRELDARGEGELDPAAIVNLYPRPKARRR